MAVLAVGNGRFRILWTICDHWSGDRDLRWFGLVELVNTAVCRTAFGSLMSERVGSPRL